MLVVYNSRHIFTLLVQKALDLFRMSGVGFEATPKIVDKNASQTFDMP